MTDDATPEPAVSSVAASTGGEEPSGAPRGKDITTSGAAVTSSGAAAASPALARGSDLDTLGSAAWAAAAVSLVAALPGALRAGSAGLSMPLAWLALIGGSAAVLFPLSLSLRRLVRAQGGVQLSVLVAGVGLAAPLCAVLMRVLKVSTNHRPLGAATYSVLALLVTLGLLAVVGRLGVWAADDRRSAPVVFAGKRSLLLLRGLAVVGALGLCYAALPVLSTSGVWLAEGLVLLGGAVALAVWRLPRVSGPLARAGLAVWLGLVVGCCAVLLSWPSEGLGLLQRVAPVCLGLGWLF